MSTEESIRKDQISAVLKKFYDAEQGRIEAIVGEIESGLQNRDFSRVGEMAKHCEVYQRRQDILCSVAESLELPPITTYRKTERINP